jgi:two-component system, response regulator, stage 0 sporulation protein F
LDRAHASALVVEDDVMVRALLAELLEDEGYQVHTASNGFSGLRYATEQRPNVILLDLRLPELSGIDMLRELRADQHTRGSAIVVVSGNADALSERQLAEVDAVVPKPFDVASLLATVHRAIQRAATRAAEVPPVAPVVPSHERHRPLRAAKPGVTRRHF